MARYMVKNKYTYEKVRQTNYSYAPDGWEISHNAVTGRFLYEQGDTIATLTVSADSAAETTLDADTATRLSNATGLCLTVAATDSPEARIRVTLWSESVSYCSVCYATAGTHTLSVSPEFPAPDRATVEISDGSATVALAPACVLNTLGEYGGQAHFYRTEGADLQGRGTALAMTLRGTGTLISPPFPDSSDTVYNMNLPRRNTIFMVLENRSTAREITLRFATTTHPWEHGGAVTLPLAEDRDPHAYYFNLSACPDTCDGRLAQFSITADGEGEILIHRYSFEQEKPIREVSCEILSCTADPEHETVTVRGRLTDAPTLTAYEGGTLSLYATTMASETDTPVGKRLLAQIDLPGITRDFTIDGIPLRDDRTTLLPYQLALFAEREGLPPLWLCERFYVENYEDFDTSPYPFDLPDYTVSAPDFGARGDAFTNDTDAIQAALDDVAAHGGGRVVLPGSTERYGRRYVVTNLLMPSMTELHFEDGAVLWQSQLAADYPYEVAYGHDGVIPGINWTHNLHVSNLPLIQAANAHRIKITGRGTIRMMDTGSEEGVDMPGYATGCPDRIHLIPIGFFRVTEVECRDFEIIRSSNYHTEYNHCRRVYLANLRLHEVKCVSGDGFGLAAAQHVMVNRCYFQSNDDGIVMSTHYFDPRGILWWTNCEDDNSVRHIRTAHSYLNSGGGKCLAFITWGTCDPNQEREEIADVTAYDNYLVGVNPIGAWADNPYGGKQPFDNSETDDYSPVKRVRIHGNRYAGNCTLGPIAATDVLTDCGVHSTDQFRNGDFSLGGMANWTYFPNAAPDCIHAVTYADIPKGCIERFDGGEVAAAQGLHLAAGRYTVSMELLTGADGAELYAEDMITRAPVASARFVCTRPTTVTLSFDLTEADGEARDLYVGVRSVGHSPDGYAVFDNCHIAGDVDEAGILAQRTDAFMQSVRRDFLPDGIVTPFRENGKIYLLHPSSIEGNTGESALPAHGTHTAFAIECAVRAERYDPARSMAGFGYRLAIRDDGRAYRELRFNVFARTLTLTDVQGDNASTLYRRENFFFTSNDFHLFRLEVETHAVNLWIDGSQYAAIPCDAAEGAVEFFVCDATVSLGGLSIS